MKTAIITTTINIPKLLEEYARNIKRYKHRGVGFVVVGDKKTPFSVGSFCKKLERISGLPIIYLDVTAQLKYLKKYPELRDHLVYNSIQRRNIAVLYAYENGAETIITIDDDNFVTKGDFLGANKIVGKKVSMDVIASSTKWLNVCAYLKERSNIPFYHRGFPMGMRFKKEKTTIKKKNVKIVVNAGFWLEDPDVDAISRLFHPIDVVKFKRDKNFALAYGTWSPFNSQNTALAREVVPAYFLSPYIGRYDDIWGSYIVGAIANHLGHYISFGYPLVVQKRNPHNYHKDYEKERIGMILSDEFCSWLRSIKFKRRSYKSCFNEIVKAMPAYIKQIKRSEEETKYLNNLYNGLIVWEKTFSRI
jgi:hypothetical protein